MKEPGFLRHSNSIRTEIERLIKNAPAVHFEGFDTLVSSLIEYSTRGKMVRGCLTVETSESFGAKNLGDALRAAASIEILHSGILIIDDIIDRDEKRRGLPSMHVLMRKEFLKKAEKSNVTGEDIAMAVGLTATYIGFSFLDGIALGLTEMVGGAFALTGLAEVQELLVSVRKGFESEQILKVYELKTGIYSICLPVKVGLFLGNRKDLFEVAEKAGAYAGIAFQIKDDLIEIESGEEVTGKPVFSDFKSGRKNYPLSLAYELAGADERERIEAIFESGGVKSAEEIDFILSLFKKYRIVSMLKEKIKEMSRLSLEAASCEPKLERIFRELIEFNLKREK